MNLGVVIETAGAVSAILSVPGTLELGLLTAAASLPVRPSAAPSSSLPRIAVVIPAHNEQESIGNCLDSLFACTRAAEIVTAFVIADNCVDGTAEVARAKGARVLTRDNLTHRGKGHALLFGFDQILQLPFDAFLVIDADARVQPNLLEECATAFARGGQALQCPYLASNPQASGSTRLQSLALRAFNMIRPKGRARLGLSVGILGNGFGVTRATLLRVPYTAFSVVEDLEYHLNLVDAGIRVEYLETSTVYGVMPTGASGRATQRARWEGGRLRILKDRAPWLLRKILRGELRFVEILLDLLLLPLAFHVLFLLAALASSSMLARLAGLTGLGVVTAHLVAAIAGGSSYLADLKAIASVPGYICWKLLQLPRILAASAKRAAWIRTTRTGEETVA
jgi:cellulose synthase/poly-beta-1,6-N-acetylglucosamine synthase-like glycosyltransferase